MQQHWRICHLQQQKKQLQQQQQEQQQGARAISRRSKGEQETKKSAKRKRKSKGDFVSLHLPLSLTRTPLWWAEWAHLVAAASAIPPSPFLFPRASPWHSQNDDNVMQFPVMCSWPCAVANLYQPPASTCPSFSFSSSYSFSSSLPFTPSVLPSLDKHLISGTCSILQGLNLNLWHLCFRK